MIDKLKQHILLLEDRYPDIGKHIQLINSGDKPHEIVEISDGNGLLVFKVVKGRYIKVNVLHVLPAARGKSVGKMLLNSLFKKTEEHNLPFTISVSSDESRFINWLMDNGLKYVKVMRDHYKQGVDMVLMSSGCIR